VAKRKPAPASAECWIVAVALAGSELPAELKAMARRCAALTADEVGSGRRCCVCEAADTTTA
jgi:hypothetical protein